jgi:hypothetical protein
VGTTKVVLWLQLDFSLSKAADSTATRYLSRWLRPKGVKRLVELVVAG